MCYIASTEICELIPVFSLEQRESACSVFEVNICFQAVRKTGNLWIINLWLGFYPDIPSMQTILIAMR